MVNIKTLCRNNKDYERETKQDIFKINKNTNPNLHPFIKAREYQRALVATKLDKIFAKPFVGALSGHSDSISCFSKSQRSLTNFVSGSYDGEVRFWDISTRKTVFNLNAHTGIVKGVTFSNSGQHFASCGTDNVINLYRVQDCVDNFKNSNFDPLKKFQSKCPLTNIDHHYSDEKFVTSGQIAQVWSYERSQPIQTFEWGADSITRARFNPSEQNLLGCVALDRSIALYDLRGNTALKKNFLANKSSSICWNPMEPVMFTVSNEDSNCYTFDMRKLDVPRTIHKDHILAVMDLDYAPTGKEFVTGSYDKTVRIFDVNGGKSREVYHGKRMQKVFAVAYTPDSHYVLSGSEDMNIRIWKSKASDPMGVITARHERTINYREKLKDRFKYNQEIKRIGKHRHLPKYLFNAKRKKQIMKQSEHRRDENVKINNPDQVNYDRNEKKQKVMSVVE